MSKALPVRTVCRDGDHELCPHEPDSPWCGCSCHTSPPPTREPIRLTDEEREALLFGFGIRFHENADHTRFAQGVAAVESILTARFENDAATKADAWDEGYDARDRHDFRDYPGCENPYRTPESEDTE